ncbi:DUF6188 family protein [Actinoplanes flavus]|uniref:Uncharacterized protein n=1 Tax=Actinoplanes flavus TaxID=2820290 RepID=A0ABS3UTC9_9ACTN|nr:DUF6188 family protein [Actinoplanes flavus]MBO3741833.1 hypothetical protein [Actinoplanes flavus]
MPPTLEDVDLSNRLLQAVAGHRLLAFRMGGGVRLEFDDDAFHEFTIEGSLRVVLADGSDRHGDPISLDVAEQLIRLLNTPATAAVVDPRGALKVAFEDAYVVVPYDQMYEAWQVRSDEGLLIVSMPGGDLAIWPPGSDGQDDS